MSGHLRTGSETVRYTVGHGEAAVRLARRAGSVAIDIETAGLGVDAWDIHSVQVATTDEAFVLHPVFDRAAIVDVLADD